MLGYMPSTVIKAVPLPVHSPALGCWWRLYGHSKTPCWQRSLHQHQGPQSWCKWMRGHSWLLTAPMVCERWRHRTRVLGRVDVTIHMITHGLVIETFTQSLFYSWSVLALSLHHQHHHHHYCLMSPASSQPCGLIRHCTKLRTVLSQDKTKYQKMKRERKIEMFWQQ